MLMLLDGIGWSWMELHRLQPLALAKYLALSALGFSCLRTHHTLYHCYQLQPTITCLCSAPNSFEVEIVKIAAAKLKETSNILLGLLV